MMIISIIDITMSMNSLKNISLLIARVFESHTTPFTKYLLRNSKKPILIKPKNFLIYRNWSNGDFSPSTFCNHCELFKYRTSIVWSNERGIVLIETFIALISINTIEMVKQMANGFSYRSLNIVKSYRTTP